MRKIPIFMYHNIGCASPRDRKPKLYVSSLNFRLQMGLFHLFGYKGLSMHHAMPYLRGEKSGKVFVVTFDDGYQDNLNIALPILKRYQYTATCYVVSDRINQHNTWDAEKIGAIKPLMTKAELLQWLEAGMEIGAHTQTHPHLTHCTEAELNHEVLGAKVALETLLERPITQFCYPYGSFNKAVLDMVKATGYAAAATTQKGVAKISGDLFTLPRERPKLYNVLKQIVNLS